MKRELPQGYHIGRPGPRSPHYGRIQLFEPAHGLGGGGYTLHDSEEAARAYATKQQRPINPEEAGE